MLSWPHWGQRVGRSGSFLAGKRRPWAPTRPQVPAPPTWFVEFCDFPGKGCESGQPAACWGMQHRQRQHRWVPPPKVPVPNLHPCPPPSTPPTTTTQGPEACPREKSSREFGPILCFSEEDTEAQKRAVAYPGHSVSQEQSWNSKKPPL